MNHKIAILSDIHGNTTALKAVIADAKNQGVSEYWLMGDIFLPGPGANDLVALLRIFLSQPVFEAIGMIVSLRPWMVNTVGRSTRNPVNANDSVFDGCEWILQTIVWLRSLPLLEKKEVEGLRFSLSHNLPDKNYGG